MIKIQNLNKVSFVCIIIFLLFVLLFLQPKVFSQLFRTILGRAFLVILIVYVTYCNQILGVSVLFFIFLMIIHKDYSNILEGLGDMTGYDQTTASYNDTERLALKAAEDAAFDKVQKQMEQVEMDEVAAKEAKVQAEALIAQLKAEAQTSQAQAAVQAAQLQSAAQVAKLQADTAAVQAAQAQEAAQTAQLAQQIAAEKAAQAQTVAQKAYTEQQLAETQAAQAQAALVAAQAQSSQQTQEAKLQADTAARQAAQLQEAANVAQETAQKAQEAARVAQVEAETQAKLSQEAQLQADADAIQSDKLQAAAQAAQAAAEAARQEAEKAAQTAQSLNSNTINITEKFTSLEGFDLLGLEDRMKRGKQSNSIQVSNLYNKNSDNVMPYEKSFFSFFGF